MPASRSGSGEASRLEIGDRNTIREYCSFNRGTEHGVRQGNRFFAVEVRDRWKRSLGEDDAREGFPKEVLAEIRVIEVRPESSTGVITGAIRELHVGQKLEMRRGY